MANLIVDIGNTAVKASWSEGMTIGKTYRYQGEKTRDFILSLLEKERPGIMVISSVYDIPAPDREMYSNICGELVIMDSAHKDFLDGFGWNGIPSYLSCDRIASILAARYLFKGKGCTVIDFGSTLTVDRLNPDGSYAGGSISLGCRTRFKALNRYSRSLPLVGLYSDIPVESTSLEESIASGVVSGIIFEINGYMDSNPDNLVVFTGGDAIYFAKRMKKSIFVVCNLVLLGLALIADEYVKKNK